MGILFTLPRSDPIIARQRDALVGGLRDHGWEEGKNIGLEERFAGGTPHESASWRRNSSL